MCGEGGQCLSDVAGCEQGGRKAGQPYEAKMMQQTEEQMTSVVAARPLLL